MDFICLGNTAYAIKGGIQLESCEVYSDADFSYADMPPSIKAQLRDDQDNKPIYQTTMFGLTVKTDGTLLPNDDLNRVEPTYKIFKGTSIEALEVAPSVAQALITNAGTSAAYLEYLKILKRLLATPDITATCVAKIEEKIKTVWKSFTSISVVSGSLTSGGSIQVSSSATGFPVGGSVVYTYQARWGFGTLRLKLIN
jgi:hypothetical protein